MKKLLPNRKKNKPHIVLTNLVDIMFLLVFFFMITSSFAKNVNKMPVNLPGASSAATVEGDNMTIQVSKLGRLYIGKKQIQINELTKQIKNYISKSPSRPILLEADKKADYGRIVHILDVIRSNGATNVGLSTTPIK